FDKNDINPSGYYNNSGTFIVDATYRESGLIATTPNTNMVSNEAGAVHFWDANKNFLSGQNLDTVPATYTTPANCYFVSQRINIGRVDQIMIATGTSLPTFTKIKYKDESLVVEKDNLGANAFDNLIVDYKKDKNPEATIFEN